jgi:hypothetical protein
MFIFKITYFIAWWCIRPKHMAFNDEFNKTLLYLIAIHILILLEIGADYATSVTHLLGSEILNTYTVTEGRKG